MSENGDLSQGPIRAHPARAGRVARLAIALLLVALTLRTYTDENTQPRLGWYVGLMAVYLASDAASYVTGQTFAIDGGRTLL